MKQNINKNNVIKKKKSKFQSIWSNKDSIKLIEMQKKHSSKWKFITKFFDEKTQNSVKNQFFTLTRRSFRKIAKFFEIPKGKIILTKELINIAEIKPKIFTMMQMLRSYKNEYIIFDNKKMTMEELIDYFYFLRIRKLKKNINKTESSKFGLKIFMMDIKKMNEVYVSFKSNTKKIKRIHKKFEDFYFNKIEVTNKKNNFNKEQSTKDEIIKSSFSEINSIKTLDDHFPFVYQKKFDISNSKESIEGLISESDDNKNIFKKVERKLKVNFITLKKGNE